MTLQRKELELVLNGGIDEKTGVDVADPSTSRAVTNLRWNSGGKLEKRPTYASTATISGPTGASYGTPYGEAIFSNDAQVFTVSDDHGVAWLDPTTGTSTYAAQTADVSTGTALSGYSPRLCRVSRLNIDRSQFGYENFGINQTATALYDTHLVIAWTTTTANTLTYLNYRAFDITTGIPLTPLKRTVMSGTYSSAAVTAHTEPYIQAIKYTPGGGVEGVLITYTDGTAAPITIKTIVYNASTKAFSTSSDLTTNARYTHHSLAINNSPTKVYFGFIDDTANAFRGKFGNISEISGGTATAHNATTTGTIYSHMVAGTNQVLITTSSGTRAYAERWGSPGQVVTLMDQEDVTETFFGCTAAIDTSRVAADGAVVWINAFNDESTSIGAMVRVRSKEVDFSSATATVGSESVIPNAWLATQGFTKDSRAHVCVTLRNKYTLNDDGEASSVILCRYARSQSTASIVRHDMCARFCHDIYYSPETNLSAGFGNPIQYGDSVYFVNSTDPSEDHAPGITKILPQTIVCTRVRFRNDTAFPCPSVEVNGVTHIASGILWSWDGAGAFEASPVDLPSAGVEAGSAGSTTFASACNVKVIWRWTDKFGNLYRSRPSVAASTGTFTNKQLNVFASQPPFMALDGETSAFHQLEPELYITTQGPGTTYYLANNSNGAKLAASQETANKLTWKFSNVLEGNSANPQLYTSGGALESEPPPPLHDIALVQDRLWGIDAERRDRVWFTKPFASGIAWEWNATLTLTIPDDGEAVRDVNGVPTIFGKTGIYQIYGVGPDEIGTGGFFEPARKLPHQIGCIDPNSVVKIPQGVFFRSRRGFHILTTGLELVNVGLPVEPSTRIGTLADYSGTYTKAVFDEFHNEVRVVDGDGDQYFALNLSENKWARWTQDSANQYVADLAVADGRVFNLNYNGTNTDVRREKNVDESAYNSSAEGWSLTTQWVRLDGIAGYGRIWEIALILDEATSKTNITSLTVLYEYKSSETVSGSETFSWTGSELNTMSVSNLRIKPSNQRVRAFRLTVTETCSGATTGSPPIVGRMALGVDGKIFKQARGANPKGTA